MRHNNDRLWSNQVRSEILPNQWLILLYLQRWDEDNEKYERIKCLLPWFDEYDIGVQGCPRDPETELFSCPTKLTMTGEPGEFLPCLPEGASCRVSRLSIHVLVCFIRDYVVSLWDYLMSNQDETSDVALHLRNLTYHSIPVIQWSVSK